jgi:chitinase
LPASKACLGVPFYGRTSTQYFNYNAILTQGGSPDQDYFGQIGYNGRPTIRSKTTLGIQNGGIMIWDLSGDEDTGTNSLLTAIDGVVKGSQPTTCTGSGTSVPATIQAESYCQMSGVQLEGTTDTGGGQNVGWIEAGDWMAYRINVATAGTYTVAYRVASQAGGGSIRLEALGGGTVFGTISVPSTGGWQTWTTIQHNVTLSAGQQTIALSAAAGGFNINWLSINPTGGSFSTTIQAENYALMNGIQTEACSEGGLNVGWIDTGDWMTYSVTIPSAGTYRVVYRVASPNSTRTLRLEKDAGATQLGTVTIPNTGGWQNWTNVAHNVTLPAGTFTIGLATATGGFNLNYFTITSNLSARMSTEENFITAEEGFESMISPNPVQDQLFIKDSENVKYIKIYNIQGQEMISVERPGSSISVQSLKPGVHIGVVEKLDATVVKGKLVKY